MGLFQNAHGFTLSQSQFIDQSKHISGPRSGIDILLESTAPEAAYDSYFRRYAPSCFPGTRKQHIEDIVDWAASASDHIVALPIFRMEGPAGVGKSAIAQSCAERLDDTGSLGASFFFTSNVCEDYTCFFPTIAYQLSTKLPDYRDILDKKVKVDPTLVQKQLRYQFRDLITRPLRELERAGKRVGTCVILVDGLDECKDRDAQREIVEIIAEGISSPALPLRWAIFSRPEPQIEAAFADANIAAICHSVSLPVSRDIDLDIELYLRNGIQNVLRRQNITMIAPWPSEKDLRALVDKSAGLFIYAATVVRFVGQAHTPHDPLELLRAILGAVSLDKFGPKHPTAELDAFYTLILERIPSTLLPDIQILLYFAVRNHPPTFGLQAASYALGLSKTKIQNLCDHLSAVARVSGTIPIPDFDFSELSSGIGILERFKKSQVPPEQFSLHHKSFRDFLLDPNRSGPFYAATDVLHEIAFKRAIKSYSHLEPKIAIQDNRLLPLLGSLETSSPSYGAGMDSLILAGAFYGLGKYMLDFAFSPDRSDRDSRLLAELANFNYRKHLLYHRCFADKIKFSERKLGVKFYYELIEEVLLGWNTSQVRMEQFEKTLSRLEDHNALQRYHPESTTLELPLFRSDSEGHLLSGLYIRGHGDRSTFWYFNFDPEHKYYREFESIDRAEGERGYREAKWEKPEESESDGFQEWDVPEDRDGPEQ